MAKILVITVVHSPSDARITHRQIRTLAEQGHKITFAAPFSAFGVTPLNDDTIDLPRSKGGLQSRLPAFFSVRKLLHEQACQYDVVIFHDPELLIVFHSLKFFISRLPKRQRPVFVWDVHEDVSQQIRSRTKNRVQGALVSRVVRAIELFSENGLKLILAEDSYQHRFRRSHPIVRNSVYVPELTSSGETDPPRVVYLGAITVLRGLTELVELAESLPDVHFEVIGNAAPDALTTLESAAKRLTNFTYRGFVPNNQALELIPGAIAGLALLADIPNYNDSEPTKIMEYMAAGVPIITTNNRASANLVSKATAGFVVPFNSISEARSAILSLVTDRELRDSLGKNGHDFVLKNRNWALDGADLSQLVTNWADERVR